MKAAIIVLAVLVAASLLLYFLIVIEKPLRQFNNSVPSIVTMAERVEFRTGDNLTIAGDYYAPADASTKGLLLLHMMPATRASWKVFAERARGLGFNTLAIDLRGHGESEGGPPKASLAKGGPDGYKSFSDAEHKASRYDVEAGVGFLKSKGAKEIYLGGASIGANLALQYLGQHSEAKAAFLLSPGLNYRGVVTENYARALVEGQAVYYVASRDDPASVEAVGKLSAATPSAVAKETKIFDEAGHGTTIFDRELEFADTIATWLAAQK